MNTKVLTAGLRHIAQLTEQPNSGKNTGFMGFILQLESKSRCEKVQNEI